MTTMPIYINSVEKMLLTKLKQPKVYVLIKYMYRLSENLVCGHDVLLLLLLFRNFQTTVIYEFFKGSLMLKDYPEALK